mgnify:CR=1 FL=1
MRLPKLSNWFRFQNSSLAVVGDILCFRHSIAANGVPRMYSKGTRRHQLFSDDWRFFLFLHWRFLMFLMLCPRNKSRLPLRKLIDVPNRIQTSSLVVELGVHPVGLIELPALVHLFFQLDVPRLR